MEESGRREKCGVRLDNRLVIAGVKRGGEVGKILEGTSEEINVVEGGKEKEEGRNEKQVDGS